MEPDIILRSFFSGTAFAFRAHLSFLSQNKTWVLAIEEKDETPEIVESENFDFSEDELYVVATFRTLKWFFLESKLRTQQKLHKLTKIH